MRKRDAYAATKGATKRSSEVRDSSLPSSDLYKQQAFWASLITSQQNASAFHAFKTNFFAMANQQPLKPLELHDTLEIPT